MEIIATIRCSQTHSQQTRVSFPYINIHPGNMPRDDDNNNNSTTVGITKHIGCYLNILMYKTVCVCVCIFARAHALSLVIILPWCIYYMCLMKTRLKEKELLTKVFERKPWMWTKWDSCRVLICENECKIWVPDR
jgi:hypothetical protein